MNPFKVGDIVKVDEKKHPAPNPENNCFYVIAVNEDRIIIKKNFPEFKWSAFVLITSIFRE